MLVSLTHSLAFFGTGALVTKEERKILSPIVDTVLTIATLTNDYYSWPKEIVVHIEGKLSGLPFNSVGILMSETQCSEAKALEMVREKIYELEKTYMILRRTYEDSGNPIP